MSRITVDGMSNVPAVDMEKLKAEMAAEVERTSQREFSRRVTGGTNESFYRNFLGGQDRRMSASVFLGIVAALGREPQDFVIGAQVRSRMPNATVLTSTFAMILDSLGIDPYAGELARKLALQFPGALKAVEDLHAQRLSDGDATPSTPALDRDEDQPAA